MGPLEIKLQYILLILVLLGSINLSSSQANKTDRVDERQQQTQTSQEEMVVKEWVKGSSQFAIDLYQKLLQEHPNKNLFFSPYSLSLALLMAIEGARGNTAKEMGDILHFPIAAQRIGNDAQLIPWETQLIHRSWTQLNKILTQKKKAIEEEPQDKISVVRQEHQQIQAELMQGEEIGMNKSELEILRDREKKIASRLHTLLQELDSYELLVANALWGEKTFPFEQNFIETLASFYQTGGFFPADFIHDFEAERKRINAWSAKQTRGRIKEVLPPKSLKRSTRLIIANAVYFTGNWTQAFKKELSKCRDFTLSTGKKIVIPLMAQYEQEYAYAAFPKQGFRMLELPYRGGDLSMLIFLPDRADGLSRIETQLSTQHLNQWVAKLSPTKIDLLFLPKFSLKTSYRFKESLQTLGMKDAFSKAQANFNGMSMSRRLFIDQVYHNAFLKLDEKGTEAAAVTTVVINKESYSPPVNFLVDRPFISIIRDRKSGMILFIGRILNPIKNH